MTKARAKTNAIRKPGKERPAASQSRIQRPPTTEPHLRNADRITKPSAGRPMGQTAEGLDHRFLRSQPRVIGPGSLRKARPRQSDSQQNTQAEPLEIGDYCYTANRSLQMHPAERQNNHVLGQSRWPVLK